MRKHCSDVCKLCPCLNKESRNSARLRTIATAALQRQYSQTELIFWIPLVKTSKEPNKAVPWQLDKRSLTSSCCNYKTHSVQVKTKLSLHMPSRHMGD